MTNLRVEFLKRNHIR